MRYKICTLSALIMIILITDSCADDIQNNLITTYDPGETASDFPIGPSLRSYGQITEEETSNYLPKQRAKIKFEDQNSLQSIKFEDDTEDFHDIENYNNEDDFPKDTGKIVFEDNSLTDNYSKTRKDTVKKPIKFENNEESAHYENNFHDSDKNTGTERVTFDGSNGDEEPVRKKKRKPKRKPRYQKFQGNSAHNSLYPGYPYSGNANLYPTSGTSGYQRYPGIYSPLNSGYGLYQPLGNQGLKEPTPVNPVAYPSSGQVGQNGDIINKYPSQGYGFLTSGASLSGKPGTYPEYPYNQGYPVPQAYPGNAGSQYPVQSQAGYRPGQQGGYQPGYQNGLYRPLRRPQPQSLPQRAVSAVAEALTSIALYDDYQCVPKLLCEVAGGRTASSPTLLKATAGLQPLLTLLQAYNGVSSSPLFVFGRAAVMGMTSNGNTAACRYAYPKCPNDPTELVNYLNNHNGGFFRFFGQPEVPQKQQNLEQFYNYLSGQYGFQQQPQQNGYRYLNQFSYGLQTQKPYTNPQKYGLYNQQNSFRNDENKTIEAEERIQNKPNVLDDEDDFNSFDDQYQNSKWLFPDEKSTESVRDKIRKQPERAIRASKTLKFPDDRSEYVKTRNEKPRDYIRKYNAGYFPAGSYFQINQSYQTTSAVNPEEYVFDHKHNFYVKRPKQVNNDNVVYIVRGNGDPNHPEVVKVQPGQSIS